MTYNDTAEQLDKFTPPSFTRLLTEMAERQRNDPDQKVRDDAVFTGLLSKSYEYVADMGFSNAIGLALYSLNPEQLRAVAPTIRKIMEEYPEMKTAYEAVQDPDLRKTAEHEATELNNQNLGTVYSFLINVGKVAGTRLDAPSEDYERKSEVVGFALGAIVLNDFLYSPDPEVMDIGDKEQEVIMDAISAAEKMLMGL